MLSRTTILIAIVLVTLGVTASHVISSANGPSSQVNGSGTGSTPTTDSSSSTSNHNSNQVFSGRTRDNPSPPPANAESKSIRNTPTLDGVATGGQGKSGTCRFSWTCALLSTSHANDVVIVVLFCYGESNLNCKTQAPTVSDSIGLTYSLHRSYCFTGSRNNSCVWDYYAVAFSTLHGDNITNANLKMFAFAVTGADKENIFDPKLPAGQHCAWMDGVNLTSTPANSDGPGCTVGFSTSNDAHDYLFTSLALYDTQTCASNGLKGWGLLWGFAWAEVDVNNTVSGNYSFTCPWPSYALVEMVDGIQGAVQSQSQSSTSSSTASSTQSGQSPTLVTVESKSY